MPLRCCLLLLLLVVAPSVTHAGPYSDLFVFGDSLSDVGNTDYWTTDGPLAFFAPDTPGNAYFDGRFTNGQVWTEWLAEGLGFGPLEPDTAAATSNPNGLGGNSFAYGGAYTSGSPLGQNFYVDDFDDQVNDYLSVRSSDADALYTVLIGANNFILGEQTNTSVPAAQVGNGLSALAGDGAANFLVLNLPWLGLTPAHNGTIAEANEWNQRSQDYNAALASELDAFELANPEVTVYRLDLAQLLIDLIADAANRGFTNTTDSAAPGLEAGLPGYDQSQIVANPNEYLFWDNVHPTASVHRLLGYEALRAVLPEGDYNYDGQVTVADYQVWRDAYGSRDIFSGDLAADGNGDGVVDLADYTLWRDNQTTTPPAQGVPEPTAYWVFAVIGWGVSRRRSL